MRKIKQALVMLLAAVMLLGTVTTAMAATAMTDKGSVKITNAVAGVTYKLYRIFDISGISGDNKAAFITNAKWNDAVRNFNLGFGEFVGTGVGSAVTIKDFNSDANAQALAEKVVEAAAANSIAPDVTASTDASGEKLIENLQYGFYVMVSDRQGDTAARYTTFTVMSANAVEVNEKNTKAPTIDKKVDNLQATSADFNQVLNYTITVTAAAGTDTYTITDTLPTQITLDTNSVTISKNGTDLTITNDYTLTATTTGFTLTLTPAARAALKDNDVLVVSYQATLQPNTTTMDAYTNTATLSYGEDKNISDTADVFSGHITFEKRDNHNNILAGAKFVVKNLDGQYAKLNGSGHTWAFDSWVDDAEQATVITTENTTTAVIVRGLKSGIYKLVETEAPAGYVKGADTEITINKELSEEQGNRLIGLFTEKATVINTQGSELPETGGIGTTIFYIAGALLAVSAVALLIVKRRKQA